MPSKSYQKRIKRRLRYDEALSELSTTTDKNGIQEVKSKIPRLTKNKSNEQPPEIGQNIKDTENALKPKEPQIAFKTREPETAQNKEPQTARNLCEEPQTARNLCEEPQTARNLCEEPQTARNLCEEPQTARSPNKESQTAQKYEEPQTAQRFKVPEIAQKPEEAQSAQKLRANWKLNKEAIRKEKHRVSQAKYGKAHPLKIKETRQLYNKTSHIKVKQRNQKYAKSQPAKVKAAQNAYRKANLSRFKLAQAKYRLRFPDKIKQRKKDSYYMSKQMVNSPQSSSFFETLKSYEITRCKKIVDSFPSEPVNSENLIGFGVKRCYLKCIMDPEYLIKNEVTEEQHEIEILENIVAIKEENSLEKKYLNNENFSSVVIHVKRECLNDSNESLADSDQDREALNDKGKTTRELRVILHRCDQFSNINNSKGKIKTHELVQRLPTRKEALIDKGNQFSNDTNCKRKRRRK